MRLSNRATNTPPSPIRSLSPFADSAKRRGISVFHLNIGQPDIAPPQSFIDFLKAYDSELVQYEHSSGNALLRSLWVDHLNVSLNLDLHPDDMLVTMGASEALVFVFMLCLDPGDEVLVFDPSYANYQGFAAISGVKLVSVDTAAENNYHIPSLEHVKGVMTGKTKMILLCNPNNPTGTHYHEEEVKAISDLAKENNLILVVDETYRELVYDQRKPFSVFNVVKDADHVIVVDSLSKRYSLCGARIGCLICKNRDFNRVALHFASARLAAPTIDQAGAIACFKDPSLNDYFARSVQIYETRRNAFVEVLNSYGYPVNKPEGAFYIMVDVGVSGDQFSKYMLTDFSDNEQTVFVAPASGFYVGRATQSTCIRASFVIDKRSLERSAELLHKGVMKYKQVIE